MRQAGLERNEVDVVVVGAGMAGLAAADALAESGLTVQIIEAAPAVGGLTRTIEVAGEGVEADYHHIFRQDRELRDLIDRLGLAGRFEWRHASTAVLDDGRVYPFDTVLALLRYSPLSLWSRFRLGAGAAVSLTRGRSRSLDRARGRRRPSLVRSQRLRRPLEPLLDGKFGPLAPDVAMAWLAGRVRQRAQARKRGTGDRLGYVRGGVGVVAERLAADLTGRHRDGESCTRGPGR